MIMFIDFPFLPYMLHGQETILIQLIIKTCHIVLIILPIDLVVILFTLPFFANLFCVFHSAGNGGPLILD